MTKERRYIVLALLLLALAGGLVAYNLNRGPSNSQPTSVPVHLY